MPASPQDAGRSPNPTGARCIAAKLLMTREAMRRRFARIRKSHETRPVRAFRISVRRRGLRRTRCPWACRAVIRPALLRWHRPGDQGRARRDRGPCRPDRPRITDPRGGPFQPRHGILAPICEAWINHRTEAAVRVDNGQDARLPAPQAGRGRLAPPGHRPVSRFPAIFARPLVPDAPAPRAAGKDIARRERVGPPGSDGAIPPGTCRKIDTACPGWHPQPSRRGPLRRLAKGKGRAPRNAAFCNSAEGRVRPPRGSPARRPPALRR